MTICIFYVLYVLYYNNLFGLCFLMYGLVKQMHFGFFHFDKVLQSSVLPLETRPSPPPLVFPAVSPEDLTTSTRQRTRRIMPMCAQKWNILNDYLWKRSDERYIQYEVNYSNKFFFSLWYCSWWICDSNTLYEKKKKLTIRGLSGKFRKRRGGLEGLRVK